MLTDTVSRTFADGTNGDMPLLDGFLNPPAYYDDGKGGRLTPAQAAGAIAMGMSDQTGNELDEFVTETLRNNLLGLPLDLPTINMTRARETGVPTLNNFRKQLNKSTNDSSLQPYSSWVDFGLSLKHSESVVNFMAAYGKHPSIVSAPTLQAKRAAAQRIYDNDRAIDPATPEDAYEFVNSTTDTTPDGNGDDWSNTQDGVSRTGLDDVDLWVGGLAESQNLFGGLLGSTFNYVFERQLTDLQDGDRLYYLSRTSGLNLRTQLEGNSYAELVMRNTDASALKADPFGTADCEFELANLGTSGALPNDPASECDETKVLIRMPDGTIRYRQSNSVDPAGLNAQSTFNGTAANDRMWGGIDDDTFWGNAGNDRIEGNDGADTALGGEGDDIITDSAGDDVHKGGDGNDAIDAGPGLDVIMGGNGKDFTNGGLNSNQTFAGEGDDFVMAGDGPDTVFGGGGDDWQEGGNANDLLQGDSGAPFFDDINAPGHDVLIGGSGEDDYDAEGGDDIMVAGPGIERNHGTRGFDWAIHARSPDVGDSDLTIHINAAPGQLADRFLMTEALSGWDKDDILKGDDWIPLEQDVELHAPWGSNALTTEGIARIKGLDSVVAGHTKCVTDPQLPGDEGEGGPPASGPPITVCGFGEGNILLGGSGSDLIQGRGANDLIDGDKWLNVRLSVRTDPANPATETRSANSMTELAADVFAGRLNPGNIVIVREILSSPGPSDVDTAVYAGPRADYDITVNADSVTVAHVRNLPACCADQGGPKGDGTDSLRNIEKLQFADQVVVLGTPDAPRMRDANVVNGGVNVRWFAPANNGGGPIIGYDVLAFTGTGTEPVKVTSAPATARNITVTGLAKGNGYTFKVVARNAIGASVPSAASNRVNVPRTAPGAPVIGTVTAGNGSAVVNWAAPADNGGAPINRYTVQVYRGRTNVLLKTVTAGATATSATVTGLTSGQSYTFRVVARNTIGDSPQSDRSDTVTLAAAPAAPRIGTASSGAAGGNSTASIRWRDPQSDGGSPITGYLVQALPIAADGSTQAPFVSSLLAGNATTYEFALPPGDYRFRIIAVNAMGESQPSADSNQVTAR
jgi:Ca2+-binding RTX toxin-like protein